MTSPNLLVDTSVAVPLVLSDHQTHEEVTDALDGKLLGLAGHAWLETYSVLTRLPPPARRHPVDVVRVLEANFPETRFLDTDATQQLLQLLPGMGVTGGAIYDAVIGYAAATHDLPLATRDRRAVPTYRSLGVEVSMI